MDQHELHVEGDTVYLKWSGELSLSDIRETLDALEGVLANHTWVFIVIDARNATGWGSDARKLAIDWPHQPRVGAVVQYGASLTMRALTGFVSAAVNLLKRSLPTPTYFVNDEAEARACVERRRRELLAGAGRPRP